VIVGVAVVGEVVARLQSGESSEYVARPNDNSFELGDVGRYRPIAMRLPHLLGSGAVVKGA